MEEVGKLELTDDDQEIALPMVEEVEGNYP